MTKNQKMSDSDNESICGSSASSGKRILKGHEHGKKSIDSHRSELKRKIEELGSDVFTHGMKGSGDCHIEAKENISDYLRREFGKEMRSLGMNSTKQHLYSQVN